MKVLRTFTNIVLPVSCMLLGQAFAKADTTFDVTGSYTTPSAGTFSGVLTVNTDSGTLDSININFGTLPPFNSISNSEPSGTDAWGIGAVDDLGLTLFLKIDTTPTAVSLTGLTSGAIVDGAVLESLPTGVRPVYAKLTGSITPALSAANAPEPSSLALLALGFLAWLVFQFIGRSTLNRRG